MAVICLVGPPGCGKTYHAVYHEMLPALKEGRRVITNIPLDLRKWEEHFPELVQLIEVREQVHGEGNSFNRIEHYPTQEWWEATRRDENEAGPLLVIDEAQFELPRTMETKEQKAHGKQIVAWIQKHRHLNCNVVLCTQDPSTLNRNILGCVEVFFHFRKNRNLGMANSYRMGQSEKARPTASFLQRFENHRYDPKLLKLGLYKTHSMGGRGKETGSAQVKPIWRHWSFYVLGAIVAYLGWAVVTGRFNPGKLLSGGAVVEQAESNAAKAGPGKGEAKPAAAVQAVTLAPSAGKYRYGKVSKLAIVGGFRLPDGWRHLLKVTDENGAETFRSVSDLERVGWKLVHADECFLILQWRDKSYPAECIYGK